MTPRKLLRLLVAELRRGWRSHFAYPLQAVSELAGVGIAAALVARLPVGVVVAGTANGSGGLERQAAARLVGFLLALVALAGLQGAHRVVTEESDAGTLEHLCLAPVGLPVLIATRCIADTIRLGGVVALALAVLGPPSEFPRSAIAVLAVSPIMNMGMLGLGFILGGLALVFKRIGFIANLASIALLPLAVSSVDGLPQAARFVARLVPFTHAVEVCRAVVVASPVVATLAPLRGLLATAAAWYAVGAAAFALAELVARRSGLLGKR